MNFHRNQPKSSDVITASIQLFWQSFFYLIYSPVPEYEVTALYQSDEYGNKVENLLHGKTRARRATYEQNSLYYNIQAFGRSMLLNVTQMKPPVSSNALIQTVHNDGTSTYKDIPHGLHYTGHVVSDPDSLVALRENKGLVS